MECSLIEALSQGHPLHTDLSEKGPCLPTPGSDLSQKGPYLSLMKTTHLFKSAVHILVSLACVQAVRGDDFNRPNVGYTHTASKLGWYWQASGAGTWSLASHEIVVNTSDASRQEAGQTLYHTRVSLKPGDWSASVAVGNRTSGHSAGMVFMVGAGGNDHYQVRLRFGTQQVQVLQSGSAGSQTIFSDDAASSETFDTAKLYTLSVGSQVATQFNWNVKNPLGAIVASGTFTDSDYTSGYAGIITEFGDATADICRFDNFHVREITVPPITRPHPRLLVTPTDLTEIQADITAHVEPRYSAWLNLKSRADAWCQNPVTTPYTGQDSMAFFNAARGAGHAASKMALAYLLNGNPDHAAKAKEILLAWAQATPRPGTDFPSISSDNFVGGGMLVARGVNGLVYAYDYLYNDMTPAERTVVESWFRDMLPIIRSSIDRWDAPFEKASGDPRGYTESSNLDNIYFYGQLYQNHVVSNTMGYMLFGYALGDQEVVQFAVDSPENPRSYLNLFEGNILMSGETSPDCDTTTPAPQDGEIYDRSRHFDTAGSHPNGVGIGYSGLSLHQMVAMSEVLYTNGLNFYTRVGAHGETLEKPFTFYADFYRLCNASIKGGYYSGESISADYHVAVFEVANKRYPNNPEITALLDSVDRVAVDAGGYVESYFCYPTLTHATSVVSQPVKVPTIYWDGAPGTSDWGTLGNWNTDGTTDASDPSAAPGIEDIAVFNRTTTTQPAFTGSPTVGAIWLTGSAGNTTVTAPSGTPSFYFAGAQTIHGVNNVGLWMDDNLNKSLTVANNLGTHVQVQTDQTWYVGAGNTLTLKGDGGGSIRLNSRTLTLDIAGTAFLGRWNNVSGTAGTLIKKGAGTANNTGGWSTGTTITQVQLNGGTFNLNLNWMTSKLTATAGLDFTGTSTLGLTSAVSDLSSKIKIEDGVTATIDTGANSATYTSAYQVGSSKTGAFTKAGTGTLYLNATQMYNGATTVKAGTLGLGVPAVSSSSQTGTTTTNGAIVTAMTSTAGLVPGQAVSGTGIPASTTLLGIVSATSIQLSANATAAGTNTLTFGTYAGSTTGALSANSRVILAAGATLDVSGLGAAATYTLGTSASLTASGTGSTVGTSAAAIKGGASGTVSLGARPITLNYDGAHPALYVSQGSLSLGGNVFTVVVPGAALGDGAYTLLSAASINAGSTVNATPLFTGGNGLATGATGVVSISDATVVLTVSGSDPFAGWIGKISGVPVGQAGFGDDPNHDGVANGLAWMLSGGAPMGDSRSALPTASQSTGKLILEFTCLKPESLGTATLQVQFGNTLDFSQKAGVPGSNTTVNGVVFTITPFDATHNHVHAEIPESAAPGGKLFSRLCATLP